MTNLNLIKKFFSKEDRKVSFSDTSKLLAECFNGEVIQVDEEYIHES